MSNLGVDKNAYMNHLLWNVKKSYKCLSLHIATIYSHGTIIIMQKIKYMVIVGTRNCYNFNKALSIAQGTSS